MEKIQPENRSNRSSSFHQSVMVSEVLRGFKLDGAHSNNGKRIIDATLGLGGHTQAIVERGASVLGMDMDPSMLEDARNRLKDYRSVNLVRGNFKDMAKIASVENFREVDGVLFDLGVSSPQLTSPTRGFSFAKNDADLDMRIDTSSALKASDLLNILRLDQLEDLFERILTKKESKTMALEVCEYRKEKPIATVGDFLAICKKVFGVKGKINPATRAFLALRIAVNSELENLEEGLAEAFSLLRKGGRILVVSFHSKEDVLVKNFFKSKENLGLGRVVSKKPIIPQESEVRQNPRARSAKLRIFEKI
jgi:16S rRNA (cytosine1402-N4)-methyltransferase